MLKIFKIKKVLQERKEAKLREKEYRLMKQFKIPNDNFYYDKIIYQVNPFVEAHKAPVKTVEDIKINIDGLFSDHYELKYLLHLKQLKFRQKKQIINALLKNFEFDYYRYVDEQLTSVLERASFNPIKRVKMIKERRISFYIFFTLILIIFLKQLSILQSIKKIGPFFKQLNTLLLYNRFYTITVVLGYLSILIAVYLIIVKVYFSKVIKYGLSAKGFLIKERDRMLKKSTRDFAKLKKHLYLVAKNNKPMTPYKIDDLYNSEQVIEHIKSYGYVVIKRVGYFTTYYNLILLFSRILSIIHLAIFSYLVYYFIVINNIL